MILLALLAFLSVAAVAGSIVTLSRDGYRPLPTDRTRLP
jgi:hypothetical protein